MFGFEIVNPHQNYWIIERVEGELKYKVDVVIERRRGLEFYLNGTITLEPSDKKLFSFSSLNGLGDISSHLGNFHDVSIKSYYKISNEDYTPWLDSLRNLIDRLPKSVRELVDNLCEGKIGQFDAFIFGLTDQKAKLLAEYLRKQVL